MRAILPALLTGMIVGCGDTGPLGPELEAPQNSLVTETATENITVPVEGWTVPHPCPENEGEIVVLNGTIHMQTHATINGTYVHSRVHSNTRNMVGTGQLTGATYRNNDEQEITINSVAASPATFELQSVFLRQGEVVKPDDFISHITLHITFNALGSPTAQVENIKAECR